MTTCHKCGAEIDEMEGVCLGCLSKPPVRVQRVVRGERKQPKTMKCEICNKSAATDGVALYRVNELGVTGIWRCTEHLTPEQKQAIDPEVKDIVETIQASNNDSTQTR